MSDQKHRLDERADNGMGYETAIQKYKIRLAEHRYSTNDEYRAELMELRRKADRARLWQNYRKVNQNG